MGILGLGQILRGQGRVARGDEEAFTLHIFDRGTEAIQITFI
jgi:hypothetical protein